MAANGVDWLGIAGALVRVRPKASIAIAFELGFIAAKIIRKTGSRRIMSHIPSKFIELSPPIGDVGGFLDRRRQAKTSVAKRASKAVVKKVSQSKKLSKATPPAQNS